MGRVIFLNYRSETNQLSLFGPSPYAESNLK
jgi:hypothetical protein